MDGLVALVGLVIIVLGAVVVYRAFRARRRDDARRAAWARVARAAGGAVHTGPVDATPQLEDRAKRPRRRTGLIVTGDVRYVWAVDLPRGKWTVRVAEALLSRLNNDGATPSKQYVPMHVVEVRTPDSPLLAVTRTSALSLNLSPETEQTPFPQRPEVRAFRLPDDYASGLRVFTTDSAFAEAALPPQALDWLAAHRDLLSPDSPVILDRGLLYYTRGGPADLTETKPLVDFLAGFADRIPHHAWH